MAEDGLDTAYLRVRAIPFSPAVMEFIERYERVYVIEINRDGQLHQLLKMEYPELATRLTSVSHSDGLPLTARWIRNAIFEKEQK
jgi:2-oxoglutarate ferredoxin oxidoreductase subunit alpha